jgi:site-specific recombinase XerD
MRSYANFNRNVSKRYDQWLVLQHYSKGTKYVYRQSIRLFIEFLRDKAIVDVTHIDVRKFMLSLAKNDVSIISARRHLRALRKFYDFLNLGGLVNYVAPRLVTIRATPSKTPPHLSEDEVRRVIAVSQTPREKALVHFIYATGCRLGEVRCLRVQDLDLDARTARVTGKFGKSRVVLLTSSASAALRTYIGERKVGYVFQQDYRRQRGCLVDHCGQWQAKWRDHELPGLGKFHTQRLGPTRTVSYERAKAAFDELMASAHLERPKRTQPLTNATVAAVMRHLASRAGLTRVTAHMLRHSFATHLYEHGADVLAIQTLLGHVSTNTTARYASVSAFRLVEIFERCHPLEINHVEPAQGPESI